ncbi:MAG: hypothetical protein HQK54_13480 [Oligoflexales bacterium]|nr:hypothetical protein [Oligoflexales bacterium]
MKIILNNNKNTGKDLHCCFIAMLFIMISCKYGVENKSSLVNTSDNIFHCEANAGNCLKKSYRIEDLSSMLKQDIAPVIETINNSVESGSSQLFRDISYSNGRMVVENEKIDLESTTFAVDKDHFLMKTKMVIPYYVKRNVGKPTHKETAFQSIYIGYQLTEYSKVKDQFVTQIAFSADRNLGTTGKFDPFEAAIGSINFEKMHKNPIRFYTMNDDKTKNMFWAMQELRNAIDQFFRKETITLIQNFGDKPINDDKISFTLTADSKNGTVTLTAESCDVNGGRCLEPIDTTHLNDLLKPAVGTVAAEVKAGKGAIEYKLYSEFELEIPKEQCITTTSCSGDPIYCTPSTNCYTEDVKIKHSVQSNVINPANIRFSIDGDKIVMEGTAELDGRELESKKSGVYRNSFKIRNDLIFSGSNVEIKMSGFEAKNTMDSSEGARSLTGCHFDSSGWVPLPESGCYFLKPWDIQNKNMKTVVDRMNQSIQPLIYSEFIQKPLQSLNSKYPQNTYDMKAVVSAGKIYLIFTRK